MIPELGGSISVDTGSTYLSFPFRPSPEGDGRNLPSTVNELCSDCFRQITPLALLPSFRVTVPNGMTTSYVRDGLETAPGESGRRERGGGRPVQHRWTEVYC